MARMKTQARQPTELEKRMGVKEPVITEINLDEQKPNHAASVYDVTFISNVRGFEQLNKVLSGGAVLLEKNKTVQLPRADALRLLQEYPENIRAIPHG